MPILHPGVGWWLGDDVVCEGVHGVGGGGSGRWEVMEV